MVTGEAILPEGASLQRSKLGCSTSDLGHFRPIRSVMPVVHVRFALKATLFCQTMRLGQT